MSATDVAHGKLGFIEGQKRIEMSQGIWRFDDSDWALFAQLCDPVYAGELLFSDYKNRQYGGCYHVMDFQYPLFRPEENYEARACARSVGKTESLKADAVCHVFRRQSEDLLITAPELIHLYGLTQPIEERILEVRLLREYLRMVGGKTGITHKPFEIVFDDGTRIIGRIPKLSGTGVKGMHEPDLRVEEAQDYPEAGWTEVHETVIKDHVDGEGLPDFTYYIQGVHTGSQGKFFELTDSGDFKLTSVTATMRPGWGPDEKRRAIAMYGGSTQSPDYRRNILGEAGGAASAFFVMSRLMLCMDQDRDSIYNTHGYKSLEIAAEEIDRLVGPIERGPERTDAYFDMIGSQLDLPELNGPVFTGSDIGLLRDPTLLTIWCVEKDSKKRDRLTLRRMYHLWRFREKMVRMVNYHLGWKYGKQLQSNGLDVTGLGLPLFQAMEDDESAPQHLLDVSRGYVFNAKMPIGVDPSLVDTDSDGNLRAYGTMVEVEEDPFTLQKRYIIKMTMIEASTRYLREDVDRTYLQLPFDQRVLGDMKGETESRVRAMAGLRAGSQKTGFHILDSMRAMRMASKQFDVDALVGQTPQAPVMARAVDVRAPSYSEGFVPG